MGVKGKVQEWCRLVWMGVEMWERGVANLTAPHPRVPHLRDGFIVAKVGHRAKHDPSLSIKAGIFGPGRVRSEDSDGS